MASEHSTTPPRSFWITCSVLLIWNLLGLMAFFMQVTMSDEALAALPEAQQEMYQSTPTWVTVAFAVAVLAGTLGCVLLLLRKSSAVPVLIASLVGVVAQMTYIFALSPTLEVMGASAVMMPSLVVVGAIFLIWYARKALAANWLT